MDIQILFYFILIASGLSGCSTHERNDEPSNLLKDDSFNVEYIGKTSEPIKYGYKNIKYNIYQDKDGNLYEKKVNADDGYSDKRSFFYDSLIFYGEYPNRVPLKQILDIESYNEFKNSPFSRDKKRVYFGFATSDGFQRYIVEGADSKTFKPLKGRWGRDNWNVFYGNYLIDSVELSTFQVNEQFPDSAKDRNWNYFSGERLY